MKILEILGALGFPHPVQQVTQFHTEEDGTPYNVWKLDTDRGSFVLKKTSADEKAVYEAFFTDGGPAPAVYAFGTHESEAYMLMEYAPGTSMSNCTRPRLQRTLDALIASQAKYWDDTAHREVGYGFSKSWPNRLKRLSYMRDLAPAYQAYLDAFAAVPRTLCNDDMLPFNVLADDDRAVIIDWEYAGILPYPCAISRFLAFGEEDHAEMFFMSAEDKQFALDYYYENLVRHKGISRSEYDRTIKLFFFKEYSEWVYCAGISGDYGMDYYKKYYAQAKHLAQELGLYPAE